MVQILLPPLRSSVPAQSKLSIQANLVEGSRHEGDSTAGPSGDKRKKEGAIYRDVLGAAPRPVRGGLLVVFAKYCACGS